MEGLVLGTCSGDVDPGLLSYQADLSLDELTQVSS